MKTNYFNLKKIFPAVAIMIILAFSLNSCQKSMEREIYRVFDVIMLDECAEKQELNDFLQIVEKADLTGTIHAYGTYTLFGPTDEAIAAYLQTIGKKTVADLTVEEALEIVKYHLVPKALSDADFIDGRLAYKNFFNRYLTTQSVSDGGKTYFRVNRQAKIIIPNIEAANGFLHVIDAVLTQPENTVANAVRQLPEADFSFFKDLFDESGWADALDVVNDSTWFTFFVVSNESYQKARINSREDLLVELRKNTPDVATDQELIYRHIGYHIVPRLAYYVDIIASSSLLTMIPEQVIIIKRDQKENKLLLNDIQMGKNHEIGVPLIRGEYTDLSCANGVMHQVDGNIFIKNRTAYRIYWDVAEQPELMALAQFRNIQNQAFNTYFVPGELSEIKWGGRAPGWIYYYFGGYTTTFDAKFQYVYSDYLRFRMCNRTTSWMEMTTPVLIKGKYKVWLCYRREQELKLKTIFKQDGKDDQVLPYVFDLSEYMPTSITPEQMEIEGWKRYNAKKLESVVISHILGIIEVETTGRHILRFESTHEGRYEGNWDMIHFIPIDDDQLWPRVDIKGNWVWPNTPDCEIWPTYACPEPDPEK